MVEQKEELRILKDFVLTPNEIQKGIEKEKGIAKKTLQILNGKQPMVFVYPLRREIIKWIKELREARRLAKDEGDFRRIQYWSNRGILILDDDSEIIDMEGFCKLFYKITEEELK